MTRGGRVDRFAPAVGAAAAVAAVAVGVARGSFAAGGSDSSCYLGAARLFSRGALSFHEPLAAAAPWPAAVGTFAPAGHVVAPAMPATFVPMCPPGLPLLMAAFHAVHASEFLVVPLLGGMLVWLAFVIGRQMDRPIGGAAAAMLTAASPIFLYQVVQPMTDVPAAAWWLLVVACALGRKPFAAGLATSAAVLTRPNLAPMVLVVTTYLAVVSPRRSRALALYVTGTVPGAIAVALIQRAMYGSPLATGYGAAGTLFASANVVPNLQRYAAWTIGAQTPFVVLAFAAPWLVRRRAEAWLLIALALATLACYLPYHVFDDWWYIRFLLPAIPLLIVLSVASLLALGERLSPRFAVAATCAIAVAVAGIDVRLAADRHAFGFAASERHYADAGRCAARLPASAVVFTVRDSGSVHFYAGRPIVLWDLLDPSALDGALAFLRAHGRVPYLLLESDEEPEFRARFERATVVGGLDWPPIVQAGRTVRVYDPADRARYLAGARVQTEYMR